MKNDPDRKDRDDLTLPVDLVEGVRHKLLHEAQKAYEQAGIQGLCAEGRWERALDAMRTIKLGESTDGVES